MLTMGKMKNILNPVRQTLPEDDFKILDSWSETEDGPERSSKLKYLCYQIETVDPETGTVLPCGKIAKIRKAEYIFYGYASTGIVCGS